MKPAVILIILVMLVFAVPMPSAAQTATRPTVPDAEPYEPQEFAPWLLSLRRAEVIAFGSFPIALLGTRLLYGIVRFAGASISAGEFDLAYLPPLVAPPGAAPLTRSDNARIITSAAGVSISIAVIDYLLSRRETYE